MNAPDVTDLFADRVSGDPQFVVDVDGFEGPLDLLLTLARNQKVDLARISILELANQYLAFVEEARRLRLELAADYLVMAAWLAYLKSRLLVPEPAGAPEPSAADMASVLAFRLRRLEAMREAAAALVARPRLGRDVFARGAPEPVAGVARPEWSATLYDLLEAYSSQRQKQANSRVRFEPRRVWSLAEAREALGRLIGTSQDWTALDSWLIRFLVEPEARRTALASSFAATLEMVREGRIDVRQDDTYGPLWLRARRDGGPASGGTA